MSNLRTRTILDAGGRSPHVRSSSRSTVRRRSRGSLPRLTLIPRTRLRCRRLGDLALATRVTVCNPGIADPCFLGEPYVFVGAQRTECAAEEHGSGVER